MPGLPGYDILNPTENMRREAGVTYCLVDVTGETGSTRLSGLGAVDLAIGEKTRLAEAIGAASNMGVYGFTEDRSNMRRTRDATALDEAHASKSEVLVMHFENNDFEKKTLEVPAPDATLFETDGVTLKPRTDATVGAIIGELIDATENVINTSFAPLNTFTYEYGVRKTRKVSRSAAQTSALPIVGEGSGATEGPGV